jgi:peptidoglycan/LPS O-acetylase OafA/YrhL
VASGRESAVGKQRTSPFEPGTRSFDAAAADSPASSPQPAAAPRDATQSGHVPALDGVRGIAVVLVILYHTMSGLGDPATLHLLPGFDAAVFRLAMSAWSGVDLFFVLSGFLITGILVDSRGRPGYFRNFMMRRALRILPLYAAFLVIVLAVLPALGIIEASRVAEPRRNLPWLATMLQNVLIARDGWAAVPEVGHLWSIAIEEQFYLAWPLVVALVAPARLRWLLVALVVTAPVVRIVASAAGVTPVGIYVLTVTRWDALGVGALLAVALRTFSRPALSRRLVAVAACVSAVGLATIFARREALMFTDGAMRLAGFSGLAAVSGWLVLTAATAAPGTPAARTLGSAPLRFFGKYSYSIYLFHQTVFHVVRDAGWDNGALAPVAGSLVPAAVARMLVVTALTSAVALLTWHAIERPALRLKRYFPG